MVSTPAEIEIKVDKFETNMGRFDNIVNGDNVTDVPLDAGTIPTLRKQYLALGVQVTWKDGGWLTATAYSRNDLLSWLGIIYRCIVSHTSGSTTQPGIGASWNTKWEVCLTASVNDLLAGFSQTTFLGLATDPVTGVSSAGAGTFVHAEKVVDNCIWSRYEFNSSVSRTVTPAVFSKVGDDFTVLRSGASFVSVIGNNAIYPNLTANKDEWVGVTGSGSGWVTYNTLVSTTPYYTGTLAGDPPTFNDSSATGSFELQHRFTLTKLDAAEEREQRETVDQVIGPFQYIGLAREPTSGAINGGSGTLIFGQVQEDGVQSQVRYWPRAASTATFAVFSRNSDGLTKLLRTILVHKAIPGELNTIVLTDPVYSGEWLGVTGSVSGWCGATSVGGGLSETPYYIGTLVAGQMTVTAQSINTTFEIQWTVSTAGQVHEISLLNSDKIVVVGQSWEYGAYNPEDKSWANNASPWSPYQWEVFPQGGATCAQILTSLKARAATYGRAYIDMKPTITVLNMGKNDAINTPSPTTLDTFMTDLSKLVQFCQSVGSKVIICTEFDLLYAPGGAMAWRKVAEDMGCEFVHAYQHRKEMATSPPYLGFFQGTALSNPNGYHPNVRAGYMRVNSILHAVEKFGRPTSSVKYFRKRESITVSSINTDLLYSDVYERNERFKEIAIGHRHLDPDKVGYVDSVNDPAASTTTTLKMSERFLFSRGEQLDLGTHALMELVFPANSAKTQYVTVKFSDPTLEVYVLDCVPTTRVWTRIPLSGGMLRLTSNGLKGRMWGRDADTLSLLLVDSGGIVITEPKPRVASTDTGKLDRRIVVNKPKALGTQLLTNTTVATGGVLTGWTAGGGTTINTTPDFKLPPSSTGIIEVSVSKYIEQALTFSVDTLNDREVVIRAKAGYWPDIWTTPLVNTGMSIDHDTFDCRKLNLTLKDSGGQLFTLSAVVNLWWNWVEVRTFIPLDVTALTLRIWADDDKVFVDQASVKLLEA